MDRTKNELAPPCGCIINMNCPLHKAAPDMYEALKEARLQIEYLHDKFKVTGTGNQVLVKIEHVLNKAEGK